MLKEMSRISIVFCIFMLLFGCTKKSSQSASDYSDSLIILKKASDVKYHKSYGQDQISYKILNEYPAHL